MKTSCKNDIIGRDSVRHGQVKLFWDIYTWKREEIHPLALFTNEAKKLHKHDCAPQKIAIPRN
jgi:hypothetical protein